MKLIDRLLQLNDGNQLDAECDDDGSECEKCHNQELELNKDSIYNDIERKII